MQTTRSDHSFFLKREIFIIFISFFVIFSSISSVAKEPVILEMWSHWGEEVMKTKFIEETIQSFEQLHPTLTIKLRWLPKSRIYQSLQGFLPKDAGPDIFYADPYPAHIGDWVQKGYLLDLREKFDWSRFEIGSYEGLWEYPEGGIYGVPIELAEYAIYYNKEIFAEAGIVLPENGKFSIDEFLNIVKRLRTKDIIPVAIGNQDRGVASNMLFQGLLLRFAGVHTLEGLKSGVTSWDDPDIVAAIEYMKQLVDAGVFPKNMNLLKYHEGRSLFIEGDAAMYVEGTWFYGKIADENGNLPPTLQGKLGAMDYPTVPGGKGNYAIERMTGGSYVIRNSSPHTEKAVQFLNFMTSEENGLKWIQYTQSPFGVDIDFKEHVSYPFLQELFASRQDITELLVPGIGALLTPEEFKVWTRDLGISFMGGNMSVEEVIQRLSQAARKNL